MLPIIDTRVIEEIKLPLSKEKIGVKPYCSEQEKSILLSLSSDEKGQWLTNIKNIIKQNVDSGDLNKVKSSIDFLYLAIKLRMISKGDTLKYQLKCPNKIEGDFCNNQLIGNDNFDDLIRIKNADVTRKIVDVNNILSFELMPTKLEYLDHLTTLDMKQEMDLDKASEEAEYKTIKDNLELICVDLSYAISKVFVKENGDVKMHDKFTSQELVDKVIKYLTIDEITKLIQAKSELINMVLRIEKVCSKCKYKYVKEISNFFEFIT